MSHQLSCILVYLFCKFNRWTYIAIFISSTLLAESYFHYRFQEYSFAQNLSRPILNQNRISSIYHPRLEESSLENLSIKSYLTNTFFSQRGGTAEDLAARYGNKGNVSVELAFIHSFKKIKYFLVFAPSAIYQETYHLEKNVQKKFHSELIAGVEYDSQSVTFGLEGGYGYNRLDSYNLLFSQYGHFSNLLIGLKKLNIQYAFTSIYYNVFEPYNYQFTSQLDRLYGNSISFIKLPYTKNFLLYYYKVYQPKYSQQDIFGKIQITQPLGDFQYYGLEYKSDQLLYSLTVQMGGIKVNGYRDYAQNSFDHLNHRIYTSGYLYYGSVQSMYKLNITFGYLETSRDEVFRRDKHSNGFFGIASDPGIFGGKSSFLLMESIHSNLDKTFHEYLDPKKNQFENKGIKMLHLRYFLKLLNYLDFQFTFNQANLVQGLGREGIFGLVFKLINSDFQRGFIFLSACKAQIQINDTEKWEMNKSPDKKEYNRFFVSGALWF